VFIKQSKNRFDSCLVQSILISSYCIVYYGTLCIFAAISLLLITQNSFASKAIEAQSSKLISVIARTNNQIITNVDLTNRYNLVLAMSKIKRQTSQEKQILLNQILQKMIDEDLKIQKALELNITLDQEKFKQSIKEVAGTWQKNSLQIKSFLSNNNLSYNSLEKQIRAEILWSDIITKILIPKVNVSQSEINEFLELKKISSNINKLFLLEIFIPLGYEISNNVLDSKNLAYKIFNEVNEGGNFNDFVKQFSKSPTSEFGGKVGWVVTKDMDTKIYQAINKMGVGEVTSPILMRNGYYLFKIADQKTISGLDEQDLQQAKNIIFNQKLQLMVKGYLVDLHKNAYLENNY
jgi:peptidyl-prolyl cis-trans isomerase SurA